MYPQTHITQNKDKQYQDPALQILRSLFLLGEKIEQLNPPTQISGTMLDDGRVDIPYWCCWKHSRCI